MFTHFGTQERTYNCLIQKMSLLSYFEYGVSLQQVLYAAFAVFTNQSEVNWVGCARIRMRISIRCDGYFDS